MVLDLILLKLKESSNSLRNALFDSLRILLRIDLKTRMLFLRVRVRTRLMTKGKGEKGLLNS